MPDVTISFTDAQWTRVVAASKYIKGENTEDDIDAAFLTVKLKNIVSSWVKGYESHKDSSASWE